MKIQYHHMNLCTENVQRLSEFYRSVFGLGAVNYQRVNASDDAGYGGNVDFVTEALSNSICRAGTSTSASA